MLVFLVKIAFCFPVPKLSVSLISAFSLPLVSLYLFFVYLSGTATAFQFPYRSNECPYWNSVRSMIKVRDKEDINNETQRISF